VNFEKWYNEHSGKEDYTGYYVPTKEEFIRLIKTDSEFSETWGLKIEERELSLKERNEIRDIRYLQNNLYQSLKGNDTKIDWENIPTKLITLTYNNETIESYE
jgi:predicted transcriptional regulator